MSSLLSRIIPGLYIRYCPSGNLLSSPSRTIGISYRRLNKDNIRVFCRKDAIIPISGVRCVVKPCRHTPQHVSTLIAPDELQMLITKQYNQILINKSTVLDCSLTFYKLNSLMCNRDFIRVPIVLRN
jgi:hypothetical protein